MNRFASFSVSAFCLLTLFFGTSCDITDSLSNISCESSTTVAVTVSINAFVYGTAYKPTGESYEALYPGVEVEFQISKTGGDSFTQYRTSFENGRTDATNVGYNLRKGQKITVVATTRSTGNPVSETLTLDYEDAKPYNAEKGVSSQFTWSDTAQLRIPPGDPDLHPVESK